VPRLRLGAETDALVIGQFVRQCGDFDVFGLDDVGLLPSLLIDQCLKNRAVAWALAAGSRFG
jgi:hypothetical protein